MCIRPLLESFRHHTGVELDVCPTCRGAWLDRGELDQLLANGADASDDSRVPAALTARPAEASSERRSSRRKRGIFHEVKDFFD